MICHFCDYRAVVLTIVQLFFPSYVWPHIFDIYLLGYEKQKYLQHTYKTNNTHAEERLAKVTQEHLELHPYMLEKDCPICIETIPVTEMDTFHIQSCCGGGICKSCMEEILSTNTVEAKRALAICPLCRGNFPM